MIVKVTLPWSRREDSGRHAAGCIATLAATWAESQPTLAAYSHCHQQWPSCCDLVHDAASQSAWA